MKLPQKKKFGSAGYQAGWLISHNPLFTFDTPRTHQGTRGDLFMMMSSDYLLSFQYIDVFIELSMILHRIHRE